MFEVEVSVGIWRFVKFFCSLVLSVFLVLISANFVLADTLFTYDGVLRNGNGAPIPNAQIILSNATTTDSQNTGTDGSFDLHVIEGTYSLTVLTNTSIDPSLAPVATLFVSNVSISADTIQDLTIPTQTLTVIVKDFLGNPIENAYFNVRAESQNILSLSLFPGGQALASGEIGVSSFSTDASGSASVPFLPSSSALMYIYSPSGLSKAMTVSFTGTTTITVTLPQTFTYSGVFRNGDGLIVPNAFIGLNNGIYENHVVTDADGSFSIQIPIDSGYTLSAHSQNDPSTAPYATLAVNNIMISGDTIQDLVIPTQPLTVEVIDSSGIPIPNTFFSVRASSQDILPLFLFPGAQTFVSGGVSIDATTNTSGIAVVPFLPSSSLDVIVYPENLPSKTVTISFTESKSVTISYVNQLTSLAPALVWIGLRNSDDVGMRFDLLAEAYVNGNLVSSGQLNSVWGGSSGFNNARLRTITFNSFTPVDFLTGSTLSIKLYVRNACSGSRHNSGTARLWYNGALANSHFGATIGENTNPFYLINNFLLSTLPGSGPRRYIDVAAGARCSAFKPFGTWTITP